MYARANTSMLQSPRQPSTRFAIIGIGSLNTNTITKKEYMGSKAAVGRMHLRANKTNNATKINFPLTTGSLIFLLLLLQKNYAHRKK